jgi:hypothetical protein
MCACELVLGLGRPQGYQCVAKGIADELFHSDDREFGQSFSAHTANRSMRVQEPLHINFSLCKI